VFLLGEGGIREAVAFRFRRAIEDDMTPEDCELQARRILTAIEALNRCYPRSQTDRPDINETMTMILTARVWRLVGTRLYSRLQFLGDPTLDDSERLLAETGSVT